MYAVQIYNIQAIRAFTSVSEPGSSQDLYRGLSHLLDTPHAHVKSQHQQYTAGHWRGLRLESE